MVAVLDRSSLRVAVTNRRDRPTSLSDLEIADALFELATEIDRLEAEFARLAWSGHQRGIGSGGRFTFHRGLAA